MWSGKERASNLCDARVQLQVKARLAAETVYPREDRVSLQCEFSNVE